MESRASFYFAWQPAAGKIPKEARRQMVEEIKHLIGSEATKETQRFRGTQDDGPFRIATIPKKASAERHMSVRLKAQHGPTRLQEPATCSKINKSEGAGRIPRGPSHAFRG